MYARPVHDVNSTGPELSFADDSTSVFIHFNTVSPGKIYIGYRRFLRYCRSRSFKVIVIGTNRKPVFHFLLLFHCNYMYMPTCYRLRDTTIYWSKITGFRRFYLIPVSFRALAKGSWFESWYQNSRVRENCMIARSLVLSQYQRVTDRQTDGHNGIIPKSRCSIAERVRQKCSPVKSNFLFGRTASRKMAVLATIRRGG